MRHSLDLTGLSARSRRLMVLGIRGGDGEETSLTTDDLLAQVEGIDELNDDDLVALHDSLAVALDEALETPNDEAIALGARIADAIDTLRGAYLSRAAHADEIAAQAEALRMRVHGEPAPAEGETEVIEGETPEGGELTVEGETAPEGETEVPAPVEGETLAPVEGETAQPIAASTGTGITRVAARRPTATRPRTPTVDRRLVMTASANVPGMAPGAQLTTPEAMAQAMLSVIRASNGYRGPRVNIPVMHLGAEAIDVYGDERTLDWDVRGNERKIAALTSHASLRASGGICAPPQIQYDLPILGTDARPFRDGALARFGADRGGIRTLPPPLLSDVTGAVGAWTEANDVSPSSPATKACLTLDCPEETETLVDAITRCLKIGNFRARYFPEQIAAWQTKVAQYHARFAETRAITQVGVGSTQVTVGGVVGTTRDILTTLDRAGAAMRSRHRLPADFPLRISFPDWLLDNMRADLSREMPGATAERLATAEATIESWFSIRNFNVTWFLDGESGQVFGAQGDGVLLAWPSHVIGYMYPEGSWLFVDGGTLDFGITRDSVLNATNDFTWFAETFENTHFHGYESLRLDIDICPSGEAAALVDTSSLCSLGS